MSLLCNNLLSSLPLYNIRQRIRKNQNQDQYRMIHNHFLQKKKTLSLKYYHVICIIVHIIIN